MANHLNSFWLNLNLPLSNTNQIAYSKAIFANFALARLFDKTKENNVLVRLSLSCVPIQKNDLRAYAWEVIKKSKKYIISVICHIKTQ